MMTCITEDGDEPEVTAVIHPAWPALMVLLEAEQRTGDEARELREDAQRLAAAVPWNWAAMVGGGAP